MSLNRPHNLKVLHHSHLHEQSFNNPAVSRFSFNPNNEVIWLVAGTQQAKPTNISNLISNSRRRILDKQDFKRRAEPHRATIHRHLAAPSSPINSGASLIQFVPFFRLKIIPKENGASMTRKISRRSRQRILEPLPSNERREERKEEGGGGERGPA